MAGTTKDRNRSTWLPADKVHATEVWHALLNESKFVEPCDNTVHRLRMPPQRAPRYYLTPVTMCGVRRSQDDETDLEREG